jgi:hypothetical protein
MGVAGEGGEGDGVSRRLVSCFEREQTCTISRLVSRFSSLLSMLHHVDDVQFRKSKRASIQSRRDSEVMYVAQYRFFEIVQNAPNSISSLDTLASSSPLSWPKGHKKIGEDE